MGPRAREVCSLIILPRLLAEPAENSDFYLAGDYLLGGLFTLHANVKGIVHLNLLQVPQCRGYEIRVLGYDLMQAMRFAGEEINSQSSLLPGVLLGYEMVAVGRTSNDVQPVLHFPAKEDCSLPIQEDYSHWVPRAVAVLGPGNSESTVTVARFLSLFLLPQGRPLGPGITYSAISDELRDKQRFPALLRTAPGTDHQIEAMVQLMLYFRRNWIIALVSSGDYGRDNSQLLSDRPAGGDICIAFRVTLPMPQPNQAVTQWERRRLKAIVDEQRQSSARVVVLSSPELVLHNFFRKVLRQNLTGLRVLGHRPGPARQAHALHRLLGCTQTSRSERVVYPWQWRPKSTNHGNSFPEHLRRARPRLGTAGAPDPHPGKDKDSREDLSLLSAAGSQSCFRKSGRSTSPSWATGSFLTSEGTYSCAWRSSSGGGT